MTEKGESGEPVNKRLESEFADRLAEAALRCEDGEVRDLERSQVVRVSNFDVQTAARCQAKAAAPPSEFEPSIYTTSRAVALRSVRGLRRSGSVVGAVSEAMRQIRRADQHPQDTTEPDWLGLYLSDETLAPIDVRVRIAARAVTWLTTALEVLEATDPNASRRWRHDIRPRWRYPGRGLALDGRVDLAIPFAGNFTPVFVVTSASPAALDETAYNVCLWSINQRRAPDEVVVVELPTATRHILEPEELFERGVAAAARAADAVILRSDVGSKHVAKLARQPSRFVCEGCAWAMSCDKKVEFDRQPIRRGGVQLTASAISRADM